MAIRGYGLDRPGAQVEIIEREDGVLEVRPTAAVPADQAWFWSERWQGGEHRVEEHLQRGEVVRHESSDVFVEHLKELDEHAGREEAAGSHGPAPA